MTVIKKLYKEAGVFMLVAIVFFSLFAYRKVTYATYTELTDSKLKNMIAEKESFVLVTDSEAGEFANSVNEYLTKNRGDRIYYTQSKNAKKIIKTDLSSPSSFIIKKGKVAASNKGALQYYYLKDFIHSHN